MTTENKHTAEPWGVLKAGNQIGVVPVNKSGKPRDGRQTEDICSMSVFRDDADANAQLISAAPDLLAACEESLRLLTFRIYLADIADDEKRHLDVLRAAIAKAKGS